MPFNVGLPGKPETVILPEILTPGIVLDAVKPAGDALTAGKAAALAKKLMPVRIGGCGG